MLSVRSRHRTLSMVFFDDGKALEALERYLQPLNSTEILEEIYILGK